MEIITWIVVTGLSLLLGCWCFSTILICTFFAIPTTIKFVNSAKLKKETSIIRYLCPIILWLIIATVITLLLYNFFPKNLDSIIWGYSIAILLSINGINTPSNRYSFIKQNEDNFIDENINDEFLIDFIYTNNNVKDLYILDKANQMAQSRGFKTYFDLENKFMNENNYSTDALFNLSLKERLNWVSKKLGYRDCFEMFETLQIEFTGESTTFDN